MFIKKVELENIKKFDNASIEFSSGVNFISGRNGAGKTTLIESIGYAIFGAPVSNKGFLAYLLKKGQKSGRIRVTFLDKNNNELIADRKITKSSSGNLWAIKKLVNGQEEVVASGNIEVMSYLKDVLEFYPDDDMSQIYEKIVSVPQGEMTAAFFGTDKSRKEEFDPLFKLDTYRRAFERIKLIRSITDENIKIDNEISKNLGIVSNKDEIINDNKKLLEDKKTNEENKKEFDSKSKEINEKFNNLDKIKKEIDKCNSDIKNKHLELDKFNSLKEKSNNNLKDIEKSSLVISETKKDFEEYINIDKVIKEKEDLLKTLEDVKNNYIKLQNRVDNGNTKVEERKKSLLKQSQSINDDTKLLNEYEQKLNELNLKANNVSSANESKNEEVNLDKLTKARDRLIDLLSDLKIKENEIKNSFLGSNNSNKELLYLNNASNKIKKIVEISNDEIKELASSANENIIKAIEFTKDKTNDVNNNENLIAIKENIEKEIKKIITSYVKNDVLLEKFDNDPSISKEIFDEYYNSISKMGSQNEETIKINLEIENANKQITLFKNKISDCQKNYNFENDEMNHWIESINDFKNKLVTLKNDSDKYEEVKKEIDSNKTKQNLIRNNYELYLQNIKKIESKDQLNLEIKSYDEKIKLVQNDIDKLDNTLKDLMSKYNDDEYNNIKEKLDNIKENSKTYNIKIEQINGLIEKNNQTLKQYDEIEKIIQNKKDEIIENNEVIEVIKKLRNVINDAPEAISNMLIQSISNRANDIYSDIATDSNRLEWENSYELVLYDYLNGEEIKKEFKQLSGGEQMTAALAIRLAMLENLTKLNIGILDEPTTNIDSTRREKLAEIVSKVAENFNQLFVVSHDDTFENITQNVVALTGGSNNE